MTPLETMEGQAMTIDSSIWIYQFQATMRDKDGRALTRKEALNHARAPQQTSTSTSTKGKAPEGPVVIDDNAVYLEDINNSALKTPAEKN
ncbi:hypothetical protein D9615_002649 [Tricholomella constricta]|uniref:XPG N-terminal domain-containing protein n=1 Tax=Tricholomella constricta TaxID=117010 RepID=A0A8H5HM94_9AGAR|nr:hypothetical protein D9615_002649 [Tricholomella constricta]